MVFSPLVMKPHEVFFNSQTVLSLLIYNVLQGTIYFYLPEGKLLLYNLMGTTSSPVPIKRITAEIPCKTYHTEVLAVKNWLQIPQQFEVITRPIQADTLYKLTGNSVIDLTGKGKRDYIWTVYALKEGKLEFRVSIIYFDHTSFYIMLLGDI